jgi:hypothetical protein
MIRSMILVCALGAGAVGCVGTSDAADEAATAQATGSGGTFTCNNGVSVVCTGDISILNGISVDVSKTLDNNNVNVLNGGDVSVLEHSLNNLKVTDINILDGNKILDDVKAVVLNDLANNLHLDVSKIIVSVCAPIGILQVCK